MKIAIMLTGLARKVQEGYDGFWKGIIENNDVDLYLHAWETKPDGVTNNEDSDDVLKVYPNPKYINIEKPFKFTKYREGIKTPNDDKSRPLEDFDVFSNFRAFPMLYGWQETYNALRVTRHKYDCVIRSRYDIEGNWIWLNRMLKVCDLTKIYTSNSHWPNSNIHDDNFCMSNQENADKIFSNIFDDIVEYNRNKGIMDFAEQNFTKYLERNNLIDISIKHDAIRFGLLRDDKLWY